MKTLPKPAQEEILARCKDWGSVPPRRLAGWVTSHKASALYAVAKREGCFDPKRAMAAYLLSFCQEAIRLVITIEHGVETRQFVSLFNDRGKAGAGYRPVQEVLSVGTLREAMLQQFVDEMAALELRFRRFQELARVFAEVDAVRAKRKTKRKAA
jgi:hypothetical protein